MDIDLDAIAPGEEQDRLILDGIDTSLQNQSSDLQFYLNQLTISPVLLQQDFQTLLLSILEVAKDNNNLDGCNRVLVKFEMNNQRQTILPLTTDMYLWDASTIELLKFVSKVRNKEKFLTHIHNLLTYTDSYLLTRTCERLDQCYPNQPASVYGGLYDKATEFGSSKIAEWLLNKVSQVSNFIAKPSWIRQFDDIKFDNDKPIIPQPIIPAFTLPSPDTAATLILKNLGRYKINIPLQAEGFNLIKQKYIDASDDSKKAMLADIYRYLYTNDLEKSDLYFKLLGPAHALNGFDVNDYEHPCLKYGACRMYVCQHYTEFLDLDEVGTPDDWFLGACQYCGDRIENRIYALREPVITGGWRGCYCSRLDSEGQPTCLFEDLNGRDSDDTIDPKVFDIITSYLADLQKLGIQDRPERGPILGWPQQIEHIHDPDEPSMQDLLQGKPVTVSID